MKLDYVVADNAEPPRILIVGEDGEPVMSGAIPKDKHLATHQQDLVILALQTLSIALSLGETK